VTAARTITDTFAGIAPASALGFILAQLLGGAVGFVLVRALYPATAAPEPGNLEPANEYPLAKDQSH
jgi:arsenate reductase